ncbi:MAG: glutamate 5-kinase [Pseudomonadota bacterium]
MPDSQLKDFGRLVIKVGSSLLIDERGELNSTWLATLADDIATLHGDGSDVLVVSSGSIALGAATLGVSRRRARLVELQAAAAAGQVKLVNAYERALGRHSLSTAQVLLTLGDTEDRHRFLNARGTLAALLKHRIVPVINENDTVSTEEIRYGDNDRLAARVAQLVMADVLVLLSDVDGLYDADPRQVPSARHIAEVNAIDARVMAIAGDSPTETGSGGMATKVQAARIATHAGCSTIVALGNSTHPLTALADGARCTRFHAQGTPAAQRKQWLAGSLKLAGSLTIDDGAAAALRRGGSLLPVGVVAADGDFRRGDIVRIVLAGAGEIGRGLAEYSFADARKLLGVRSEEIENRLGYRGRPVLVHRDELVVFEHD